MNKPCQECPCPALEKLEAQVKKLYEFLDLKGVDDKSGGIIEHLQLKEIIPDRKRIARLEYDIIETKKTFAQVTAVRTEGTWGIAQKRGNLIYARLLSMRNGNGKAPFLPTGDIKKILGVTSYSQAKAAMSECVRTHLDIRIVERGRNKVGLELLNEVLVKAGADAPMEKKREW